MKKTGMQAHISFFKLLCCVFFHINTVFVTFFIVNRPLLFPMPYMKKISFKNPVMHSQILLNKQQSKTKNMK